MQQYINSHLNYDQIIIDQDIIDEEKQSQPKNNKKKRIPFWIQSNKYSFKSGNNVKITQQTTEISKMNEESDIQNSMISSAKVDEYYEDFQSYSEKISEQSIMYEKNRDKDTTLQNMMTVLRGNNYSAILPQIKKSITGNQTPTQRYSQMKLNRDKITKSTIELREQNKKLVRNIEFFRGLIPVYRKNRMILSQQMKEINKIKEQKNKAFDIDYQLKLDKSLQQKTEEIGSVNDVIKTNESLIKHKMSKYKNGKIGNLVKSIKNPEEQPQFTKYSIIREQLLAKKKQQDANNRKLSQLATKFKQYSQNIEELEQRSKIGRHQELKCKKMVLQYDIMMAKAQLQDKQCQLMIQITELNNKASELEIKLTKLNKELEQLRQQKIIHNDSLVQEDKKQENRPVGRSRKKLIKFFGGKK